MPRLPFAWLPRDAVQAATGVLLSALIGTIVPSLSQAEQAAPATASPDPLSPDPASPDSVEPAVAGTDSANAARIEGTLATETANAADAERQALDEYYKLLTLFADTVDAIDRNYVQSITRRELMEAAIEGMMRKLDAHSSYIAPEHLDELKTEVESEFGGLGIQISARAGLLRVISPLYDTPAYRAGILAGDTILAIDDVPTHDMATDDAVRRLKGPVGSSVTLKILHANQTEPVSIPVPREIVRVQTVLGYQRRPDNTWNYLLDAEQKVGYVRITSFSRYTGQELRDALTTLQAAGMRALVVDLRFNPGGLLSAAVEVSDLFLAQGKIVSTAGRNVESHSWDAIPEGTFEGFRMAVLVNRYSASASEIVAAALQDHGRAVIVGERTWGKASVQNIIEMEGGRSAIKLTTAGYQRPSGKNIQRFAGSQDGDWGVQPEAELWIESTQTEMAALRQQQMQLDILVGADAAGRPTNNPTTDTVATDAATTDVPDSPGEEKPFVDRPLQKAVEHLTSQIARR